MLNYVNASDVLSSFHSHRCSLARLSLPVSIYRCDIMSPFFLGYLYFYMVMTLFARLNPSYAQDSTIENLQKYGNCTANCTQYDIKSSTACNCIENTQEEDGCIIDCPQKCCFLSDCSFCQHAEWQLMTMTHISISILFVLGITGLILMYCKLCSRTRRLARTRCFRAQGPDGAMYCSTVDGLRERPPPYSEVCGAPPLYASPYNRVVITTVALLLRQYKCLHTEKYTRRPCRMLLRDTRARQNFRRDAGASGTSRFPRHLSLNTYDVTDSYGRMYNTYKAIFAFCLYILFSIKFSFCRFLLLRKDYPILVDWPSKD
ncbi:uncharacterized protein LOC105190655 isoform X2 [Harpegnathos saltator]|uniref:uncharacterized protein LOC105190655 isoform X2 n=1 Tax=Harpegnathos saltator TaxID=610380 RepID=UPI000DBEE1CD|nr:uncharacterized protein LOC105190655 isoform X2 [Harpegnathos saltator]